MNEPTRTYTVTFTTTFDFQVEVPMNMVDEREIADHAWNTWVMLPYEEQMGYVMENLEADEVTNDDSIEDFD
jgi:hypothetical protein